MEAFCTVPSRYTFAEIDSPKIVFSRYVVMHVWNVMIINENPK